MDIFALQLRKRIVQTVPYLPGENEYMGFIPSAISYHRIHKDKILNVFAEKPPDAPNPPLQLEGKKSGSWRPVHPFQTSFSKLHTILKCLLTSWYCDYHSSDSNNPITHREN